MVLTRMLPGDDDGDHEDGDHEDDDEEESIGISWHLRGQVTKADHINLTIGENK